MNRLMVITMSNYSITHRKEKGMFDISYTLPSYRIEENMDELSQEVTIQAFSFIEFHDSIVYENPSLYFLWPDLIKLAQKYHLMVLNVDCKGSVHNEYINYIISRIDNVISMHGSCKIVINHRDFVTINPSTSFFVTDEIIEIKSDSVLIYKADAIDSIDILY